MNYLWEAMLRAKEQKMEADSLRFAMAGVSPGTWSWQIPA